MQGFFCKNHEKVKENFGMVWFLINCFAFQKSVKISWIVSIIPAFLGCCFWWVCTVINKLNKMKWKLLNNFSTPRNYVIFLKNINLYLLKKKICFCLWNYILKKLVRCLVFLPCSLWLSFTLNNFIPHVWTFFTILGVLWLRYYPILWWNNIYEW